jgi:hypothetical protein
VNFQLHVEFSNEMNFHLFIRKFKPKEQSIGLVAYEIEAPLLRYLT